MKASEEKKLYKDLIAMMDPSHRVPPLNKKLKEKIRKWYWRF